MLAYERPRGKPGRGTWYVNIEPCRSNEPAITGEDCDEYPFFSTEQGGPLASQRAPFTTPDLAPVDSGDNQAQGRLLRRFYHNIRCPLATGVAVSGENALGGTPFLVVPIPAVGVPAGWLCNVPG